MKETRDAPLPRGANAIAIPAIVSDEIARAPSREDAPGEVADVQVLAVHRRPALPICAEDRATHRLGLGPHRERGAEVADQRSDDVALPLAVGRASAAPRFNRIAAA
jgi:hypothetical protein